MLFLPACHDGNSDRASRWSPFFFTPIGPSPDLCEWNEPAVTQEGNMHKAHTCKVRPGPGEQHLSRAWRYGRNFDHVVLLYTLPSTAALPCASSVSLGRSEWEWMKNIPTPLSTFQLLRRVWRTILVTPSLPRFFISCWTGPDFAIFHAATFLSFSSQVSSSKPRKAHEMSL